MVLLCRFPGGPGVDDVTGLHIPPPQAHSRTSTLSSDSQPHDLHIWLFPTLTRSCQSHSDASSPPWDFGWHRGFSPARTRVMATFAGWCCLLWLIPAQMVSASARRTWLWRRRHLASLWFAWFDIGKISSEQTKTHHFSPCTIVQAKRQCSPTSLTMVCVSLCLCVCKFKKNEDIFPPGIPGKSKPAESQVDPRNRFLWCDASHCEDTLSALRNWTEQELNSNSSTPSIYVYVNNTNNLLQSSFVTVVRLLQSLLSMITAFTPAGKNCTQGGDKQGRCESSPWCIEGEQLPWASEQKASGITSLHDEMAWWVHFKKRLVTVPGMKRVLLFFLCLKQDWIYGHWTTTIESCF